MNCPHCISRRNPLEYLCSDCGRHWEVEDKPELSVERLAEIIDIFLLNHADVGNFTPQELAGHLQRECEVYPRKPEEEG